MTRSFIIPIVRLLDKYSEEYIEGSGGQQPARVIAPHDRLKGKHLLCKNKEESAQAVLVKIYRVSGKMYPF